jgi:hypothetical protein
MGALRRAQGLGWLGLLWVCASAQLCSSTGEMTDSQGRTVDMARVLAELEQATSPAKDPGCGGLKGPGGPAFPHFRRTSPDFRLRGADCAPLTAETMCDVVESVCGFESGSEMCWVGDKAEAERFDNAHFKKRVFEMTSAFFHRIKDDPALKKRCCGANSSCYDRLAQVRLVVLEGLPRDSQFAAYHIPDNAIHLSESVLLNMWHEEGVERLILHEMGHACHLSRHWRGETSLDRMTTDICESPHVMSAVKKDFEAFFGEATSQCVLDGLNREAEHRRAGYLPGDREVCRGSWMIEAFADAAFFDQRTSPAHFAWDCPPRREHNPHGKSNHSSARPVMNCLFERPEIRSLHCGTVAPAKGGG